MERKVKLSENIRMYRAKNRITQNELGEKTTLGSRKIWAIENDEIYILRFEDVLKLSNKLDIPLENLIAGRF
ncbi:helix-turn-helix domain-containing protein [Eubacterium multiforme]|uniref:Transcriptional regulator with XRE-family HTH domain n=1 Tax=Eubacterium multiforme TaxID=83339 RepID=A0ABT9UTI2_9FIRM|nr:helix-turn-helix transcriptional regulator [Eubacterium multiforme]MDQ0149610.1 transcriptional regulator with XRE-family HTH domain [Eubacterium multiforme]